MGNGELTARQAAFVKEYLVDLNGKQAAIRAGYAEGSATCQAARLLAYDNVKVAIEAGMREREKRVEYNQDWVLKRYAMIAGVDKRQFFNADGTLKPVSEWTEEMAACVSSLDIQELSGEAGQLALIKRLRLLDSKSALDSMARHLGMFKDKVEISVDDALAERLARAKQRNQQ